MIIKQSKKVIVFNLLKLSLIDKNNNHKSIIKVRGNNNWLKYPGLIILSLFKNNGK